jgi:hypothetical protein
MGGIIGGQQLADDHWAWLSQLLERVYKDAFVHGFKHGAEWVDDLWSRRQKGDLP